MLSQDRAVAGAAPGRSVWCYLVSLGGGLYAVPDDERAVLLPFISSVPQVTPLPAGVTPPYVLGLINVAQRGELLIDLPRLLGLRDGPLPATLAESRRIVVMGEGRSPAVGESYRLAFAVDYGYELLEIAGRRPTMSHAVGAYVSELLDTPRGEAGLLDMEAVCNAVLNDMEATRLWNATGEIATGDDQ